MYKDILETLNGALKSDIPLHEALSEKQIKSLIGHTPVKAATKALLGADEKDGLPSYFGRGKNIIELFRDDTWEISMVRQALFKEEPYLPSSPNPVLTLCVAGEGRSVMTYYKINGNTEALSQAHDWTLDHDHDVEITAGSQFSCIDPTMVLDFTELSKTHVFLRIVHKPIAPLLFVFNRADKKFSYHTFADQYTTGNFFFADLINNMVTTPECINNFSDEQFDDLIAFCKREVGNEEISMKARWRLLQVLGMISAQDAVFWLKKFSNHPDPGVSEVAKATLGQMQGAN